MKYFNKQYLNYSNGFTLAEVLITLVIIGVIAALTIPAAINKMQDQEMKSQFAKAYSTISQAIYKTDMMDFGGQVNCYYPFNLETNRVGGYVRDQCTAFFDAMSKNLQVQKICRGNSKLDGCIPTYQSYSTNSGCTGYNQSNIENVNYSYILSNGQIIISYYGSGGAPLFLVDINGHKGPNAYGKDLFDFMLLKHENSGLFINRGYCEFPVSGGKTTAEMMKYSLGGKR